MREPALALAGVVVAAVCCLAAPIALAVIGGVISAAVIGWGALVVAGVAASVLVSRRMSRPAGRRRDRP